MEQLPFPGTPVTYFLDGPDLMIVPGITSVEGIVTSPMSRTRVNVLVTIGNKEVTKLGVWQGNGPNQWAYVNTRNEESDHAR